MVQCVVMWCGVHHGVMCGVHGVMCGVCGAVCGVIFSLSFQCLARGDHIASYWYSYGVFCLLTSDLDKSQQCFKEALSLDQNMVPGWV